MHFNDPGRIKVFLRDPNKKNFPKICTEVLTLWMIRKEMPLYYFKHLYRKDVKNYKDYLSTKLNNKIHASTALHKREYTTILKNKLSFSLYCEKHNIPTADLIGHNFKRSFFSSKGLCEISNFEELAHFYEGVFQYNNLDAIFFRPLALYGGAGCFKLTLENFTEQLKAEYENLITGNYVHTKAIAQHPKINAIYNKSINTMRILTHIDNGKAGIITSFMRFGIGGSVVDNGSIGGLLVGIHQESGTLKQSARQDMVFGGKEFEKHPDTDFVFDDFQIPYFKEACELAKNAAKHIPNGLVGWDVAVTPNGPVLIEGNENPSLFYCDVLYGGLLKNQHMKNLIARI